MRLDMGTGKPIWWTKALPMSPDLFKESYKSRPSSDSPSWTVSVSQPRARYTAHLLCPLRAFMEPSPMFLSSSLSDRMWSIEAANCFKPNTVCCCVACKTESGASGAPPLGVEFAYNGTKPGGAASLAVPTLREGSILTLAALLPVGRNMLLSREDGEAFGAS